MTDAYADAPAHPRGLINNPEWERTRARRADLYLAERARLYPVEQPSFATRCRRWIAESFQ